MIARIPQLSLLLLFIIHGSGMGQDCLCHSCVDPLSERSPERQRYWNQLRQRVRPNPSPGPSTLLGAPAQVVFLDFESGDNGSINYTPQFRAEIIAELESIYARFNVSFTPTMPAAGDFSTIVFNEGGGGGGQAEDIDFRNVDKNDNAVLNADGIGLDMDEIVPVSSFIAAHELGHLLGLRHADIFGPIGTGVLQGFAGFYDPAYLGPDNAFESFDHIMSTGAFGAPFMTFITPSWLSERSSIKVSISETDVTIDDQAGNNTIATAQVTGLQSLIVPNTIVKGTNAGVGDFSVSAVVVEGSIDGGSDNQDVFRIEGSAGDVFNIEVLSNVPDRLAVDPIDPNISVFDESGNFISYFGGNAFNESELKTLDSIIIDLMLPSDGPIFIQVDSSSGGDTGNYEMLVYRFNGVAGDINCDGEVNLLDVAPFVSLLSESEFSIKADLNLDGFVNLLDVNPFIALLSGE